MLMLAKEVLESHLPFSRFLVPRCRVQGAQIFFKMRAVVHIWQILNACNVGYQPYGEWGHFPHEIFCQPKATRYRDWDSDSSELLSTSGTSLTCAEEEGEENEEEDAN